MRGESRDGGESPERGRHILARVLEANGHGDCAYDLEAADDDEVAAVAYSIAEHLEEGCGAPRESDQPIAERLRVWASGKEIRGAEKMATWTRSEQTTTIVRYTVPVPWPRGSAWNQVEQALRAARIEWRQLNGSRDEDYPVPDDAIWVRAEDDQIVVYFEKPDNEPPF